jgi:SAM-dependent methyltransferase
MERHDKELNRAHYDTHAVEDRRRSEVEPYRLHSLELVVPWVASSLTAGARLLDVGGGSGAHASRLARAGVDVVGLDISEAMVHQRLADPLLPRNVVADMEALPFRDESFDGAMFVAALHHVPDPFRTLREAWRVLRPGGQLFAYEPNSLRARADGVAPIPEHPKEFRVSVGWLAARMRDAGFAVDEVRTRRLTMRAVELFTETAPLSVYHAGDRVDRVLTLVPGLGQLGTMGLVHARKPAA